MTSPRRGGESPQGWIRGGAILRGFLVLLVLGISTEILLRLVQKVTYGVPVTSFLPGYRSARFQESPFLVFGPRVDWQIPDRQIPELARFDRHGFRTIEPLAPRPLGEIRIVAMGGSTTENMWNPAGIHWPLVAQCILRREGHPVRILNAGMSAYSSAHSLSRLQMTVLDLVEPDLVLVMHLINDLTVTYQAVSRGLSVDPAYLVKYGQKGYTGDVGPSDVVLSRVLHAVESRFPSRDPRPLPPEQWSYSLTPGLTYFVRNMTLLARTSEVSGARAVFLTMPRSSDPMLHRKTVEGAGVAGGPGLGVLPALPRFLEDFDRFNGVIRTTAQEAGVAVIDLAASVPDRGELFVDPVHYSTEGVLAVGAAVAAGLRPLLPDPGLAPYAPGRECELLQEGFPDTFALGEAG